FLFHAMARVLPRLLSGGSASLLEGGEQQRVLIVGAGDMGQLLARELGLNRSQPYRPVCFIDDSPRLKGMRIHGIPVVGGRGELAAAIQDSRINLVALALPPELASGQQDIFDLLEPFKVPVRIVPSLADVMAGRARSGEMREITMEDLLAREQAPVDLDACR